jgi:hypothetical protein
VVSYPHAKEEGRRAILARLERAAGLDAPDREEGALYDAHGRRVLEGFEAFIGWARAHNLAVVA